MSFARAERLARRLRRKRRASVKFTDLARENRWVAWRLVWGKKKNGDEGKPRKVPYDPKTGRWAKVPTDPSTYSTRENAIDRAGQLAGELRHECKQRKIKIASHMGSGHGIVLGRLSDGRHILGSD